MRLWTIHPKYLDSIWRSFKSNKFFSFPRIYRGRKKGLSFWY